MTSIRIPAGGGSANTLRLPADTPARLGPEGLRPGPEQSPGPGLVPSAKTGRVVPSTLAGLDNAVVSPTLADVSGAAAAFGPSPWQSLAADSPLPRWLITPGALIATRKSARQIVRESELAQVRRVSTVNAVALFMKDDPEWYPRGAPAREVTSWSAKSRVNMVRTFAALDWGPVHALAETGRVPAMVTLTYPAAWEVVAPDGKTVKRQFWALRRRYRRAWGEPVVGAWKLEFQHRGAPHFHIFMAPPHGRARGRAAGAGLAFRHWLSVAWADIVDHPDPAEYQKHLAAGTGVDYGTALKCTDPKRLAVYFGKHGQYRDKEYQHVVPEPWQASGRGPGRFWGHWGLKPLVAAVELTGDDYVLAGRIMRRWAAHVEVLTALCPCCGCDTRPSPKPKELTTCASCRHRWLVKKGEAYMKLVRAMGPGKFAYKSVDQVTGEVVWRKHRRRSRVDRFRSGSGFLLVNDGPAVARQLARALQVCGGDRQ